MSSLMVPLDLVREILYRTPVESLVRSMLTCKQWNALIKEESFIYEHLDRSKVRFLRTDQTVQILDLVNMARSDLPSPDGFQPASFSMVHCDGLMLCPWNDKESVIFPKLALWNPLTRNIHLVERRPSARWFVTFAYYGIGYDINSRSDYKVLTFSSRQYDTPVEIYECKSKSWRTLDDARVDWDIVDPSCKGVSVKGNMYWLAKKVVSNKNYILGFDFSDETFKDICFCRLPYDNNYLGCYDGDKLSLVEQNQNVPIPIEVWVSSRLADGNVSFTKHFSVASPDLPPLRFFTYGTHLVYNITENKSIMAWFSAYTCLLFCEIDEDGAYNHIVTERHYRDRATFQCGYVYVPSLVSPP